MLQIPALPRASFRSFPLLLGALFVGAGSATGQQIFQVSPGGAYPNIQAAINAANHGDIVRVAAGTYPEFSCSKGVRLEGGPGVEVSCNLTLTSGITISGVPAGMQCVLSGITMTRSSVCSGGTPDPSLFVLNSAGSVMLERVIANNGGLGSRLIVENVVGGVLVRDSMFVNSRIRGTKAYLTNIDIQGSPCGIAQEVLDLDDAVVTIVDGRLDAGLWTTGLGIRLQNSRLVLGVAQGLEFWNLGVNFLIGTNSQVVQHSRVTPPDPLVVGGPWLRNDDPVALRVFSAPPGGVVAMGLYVYGPAVPAVVYCGYQAPPTTLPFVDGPLALSSTGLVGLPALVTPQWSTTPSAVAFGVPFVSALQGLPLVAQGFVFGGSVAPFRATNAVGFTIR